MAKEKFTIRWLERLPAATEKKENLFWDTEVAGLGVRVNQTGDKFMICNVKVRGGKRHRIALGKYGATTLEQAREAVRKYNAAAREGVDLYEIELRDAHKAATRITLNELADIWLEQHVRPKRAPRTADDYKNVMRRYIRNRFGKRYADEVRRSEVADMHRKMVKTPKAANDAVVIGKACFNWALKHDMLPNGVANPFAGVELYRVEARERFLSLDEIERIGKATTELEKEGPLSAWSAAAIRLLMLTGARKGEILSLQWSMIDFERQAMFLPKSKTGRKTIHLNPPALAVLQSLPRVGGNPHVIVGQRGGRGIASLRQPWELIRKRANIENCRMHDLRHTYASFAAGAGYSLPVIGKILGHTVAATTQRYAHLADGAVKSANDAIGNQIGAALGPVDPPSAEIIVIPRRSRGRR